MKQRILERTNYDYPLIGYSNNSDLLRYMQEFLENLNDATAQRGALAFNLSQINDFVIDYGKDSDDDFYIAFWNLVDSSIYETTMKDGTKVLHDDAIPKLKLSFENFEYIFKQWTYIKQTQPKYVVIIQDDTGFVHLYDKQQLDIEELALVEQHKKEVARWNNERLKVINSQN